MNPHIPLHQWTDAGEEVLILKWVPTNGTVRGNCSGNTTKRYEARAGTIRFVGEWDAAYLYVRPGLIAWNNRYRALTEQNHGQAITVAKNSLVTRIPGNRPAAIVVSCKGPRAATAALAAAEDSRAALAVGDCGIAATNTPLRSGYRAVTTHGVVTAAVTTQSGYASASGSASLAAALGLESRARSGPYGALVLGWTNPANRLRELRVATVGCGDGSDGALKAHTWYRLNAQGAFVEVSQ